MPEAPRVIKVAASIRSQVVDLLREAIHAGRFLPGQRLGERELCEYTGVSRTSVREALRLLEAEGYVRTLPNRGPIVATLDPDEARSIYEVRAVLEGLAGRLFAERAAPARRAALRDALRQLEAAAGEADATAWLSAITRFYDVLVEGTGNEILKGQLRTLHGRTTRLRAISMMSPGRKPKSLAELRMIVAAVESGNSSMAEQACIDHVRKASEVAMTMLAHEAGGQTPTAEAS